MFNFTGDEICGETHTGDIILNQAGIFTRAQMNPDDIRTVLPKDSENINPIKRQCLQYEQNFVCAGYFPGPSYSGMNHSKIQCCECHKSV